MLVGVGVVFEPEIDTFGSAEEAWDKGEDAGIVCEDGAGRKGGRTGAGEAFRGSGCGVVAAKGKRFHEKPHLLRCTCGQTQCDNTCSLYD